MSYARRDSTIASESLSTRIDTSRELMLRSLQPVPRDQADEHEAQGQEEAALRRLRIPFVRRVRLERSGHEEETFLLDIGLGGAFVERSEALPAGQPVEIRFAWPGSEIPFRARCRVAWWHANAAPLVSKSLPSGAGLQFTDLSDLDRERLRGHLIAYWRQDPRVRQFLRHWPEAERGDDPTAG